jgi:glycosyltransferase involved in cell wall biosynthesis
LAKRIKVLHIVTTYPTEDTQSTGFFVTNITKGMIDKVDSTILTLSHTGKRNEYKDKYGNQVIQLPYNLGIFPNLLKDVGLVNAVKNNPLALIQILFLIIRLSFFVAINGKKYNVIQGHWVVTGGLIASLTAFFHKKPIVVIAHGAEFHLPKSFFLSKIVGYVYHYATKIIFVSEYLKNKSHEMLGFLPERSQIIYNCVDTDIFYPRDKEQTDTLRVLVLKRLDAKKRVIDAIKAIETAVENGVNNIALTIIGHGPEESQLKDYVKKNNLDKYINFLGYVENSSLPEIISDFDIYLNTSTQEGFATSNVETQAVGLPAITVTGVGTEEIFTEGKNAVFVEPGNYKQMAEKLSIFARDKTILNQLSKNSSQLVKSRFSNKIIGSEYIDLYTSLVDLKKKRITSLLFPKKINSLFNNIFVLTFILYLILETAVLITDVRILAVYQADILLIISGIFLFLSVLSSPRNTKREISKEPEIEFAIRVLIALFVGIIVFIMIVLGVDIIDPTQYIIIISFALISAIVTYSTL